jgi:type I restriction enzyme, R subunit
MGPAHTNPRGSPHHRWPGARARDLHTRAEAKRADYILFHKPNIPLAVVEAKDYQHRVDDGLHQAIDYAVMWDNPFAASTNGKGFMFHDSTARSGSPVEYEIPLDQFPSPAELWQRLSQHKGLSAEQQAVVEQDYYVHGERKSARYYQAVAVNKAVEAVARGQKRLLLVMATGTGKTYTAFQIIWRLRQAGRANRVLFLVDRNVLADQALINDFQPFGASMTKITKRTIDKSYEVYLSLYQAVTDDGLPDLQAYREFSPDFFDLIVVDECHRGSAAADSAWRQVLEYFGSAVQVGLTATPKETREVSNIDYFGEPVYVYSLRQGIADGFLAPYKVIRLDIDQTTAHKRPIHAHPRRHRHHPRPIELEHQLDRPPPRMLTPKLTHQRLDLRSH